MKLVLKRLVVKQLYDGGMSYQAIGREFGVSRQRIHQIITGYRTLEYGELYKDVWTSICQRCSRKSIAIHHKDGDSNNNARSNLESLCQSHHMQAHKKLRSQQNNRYKMVPCIDCSTPYKISARYNTKRIGVCRVCYQKRVCDARLKNPRKVRQSQCISCGVLKTSKFINDRCFRCFHRDSMAKRQGDKKKTTKLKAYFLGELETYPTKQGHCSIDK